MRGHGAVISAEGQQGGAGQCGLFTGSGAVEAGCKAVIGQRLKSSGMRWTVAGADAIIALRCREASSQWEEIWQRPRNQTATA